MLYPNSNVRASCMDSPGSLERIPGNPACREMNYPAAEQRGIAKE